MKTPIHLWIIGIVSLLWNAMGAYDYLMTQLGSAAYLSEVSDELMAYINAVPTWFEAAWATGVWFSVLGSLLLLFRSRLARTAFGLSFLGLAASCVYSYGIADPSGIDVMGPTAPIFSAVIASVLILLWIYARAMTRRGVLH